MIQLIIDGITLPEVSQNRYSSAPKKLGQNVEMISGRLVQEVRGYVQVIRAQYSYIDKDLWTSLSQVLRSKESFPVVYLPDDGAEMKTGTFVVTSLTDPTFSFSAGGVPYWTGLAFTLREVKPHA